MYAQKCSAIISEKMALYNLVYFILSLECPLKFENIAEVFFL